MTATSTRLRLTRLASLALLASALSSAQPTVSSVLNGASFEAKTSPGCWATIFGVGFTDVEESAAQVPLPTSLAGVEVDVGGHRAPLGYAGPTQINLLIPYEVLLSAPDSAFMLPGVPLTVTNAEGTSDPFQLVMSSTSPSLFTLSADGRGQAHAYSPDFALVESVARDDWVVLYAACLGPTDPPADTASGGASQEPLNRPVKDLRIFVGDEPAQEAVAVLAPGFPGVFQINVRSSDLNSNRLFIESAGLRSNIAVVPNVPGENVANVTGEIVSLYPPTDPDNFQFMEPLGPPNFSAAPELGGFEVQFDILPDAQPFTVAAVGDAASAIIRINPSDASYAAEIAVPSEASRMGDFSNTEFDPLRDFATCFPRGGCEQAVLNLIPLSRMDPAASFAIEALPLPNTPVEGRSYGILRIEGVYDPAQPFRIDAENLPELRRFGGYDYVPYGPFPTTTANYALFVDGRVVSTDQKEYEVISYPLPE